MFNSFLGRLSPSFTVYIAFMCLLANAKSVFSQDLLRTVTLEQSFDQLGDEANSGFSFWSPLLNNNGNTLFRKSFSVREFVEEEGVNIETGEVFTVIVLRNSTISRAIQKDRVDDGLTTIAQRQGESILISYRDLSLDSGDRAMFSSTVPGDRGVFREDVSGIQQLIAGRSSFMPNASSGFYHSHYTFATNDNGQLAFLWDDGSGASDGIYFEASPGNIIEVARQGSALSPGSALTITSALSDPEINNSGQVVFSTVVRDQNTGRRHDALISRPANGISEAVILSGTEVSVDGSDATLLWRFDDLAISDNGRILFTNAYRTVGETSVHNALLTTTESGLHVIANEGDQAPGMPDGIRYGTINRTQINGTGKVIFFSFFTIAEFPNQSNGFGIYSVEPDGLPKLIAHTAGDIAPGTDGAEYQRLGDPQLNDRGQVAFSASFSVGGNGIFGEDASGILQPVAVTGQVIDVSNDPNLTDFRTIRGVGFSSRGLNDSGQIAFSASFTDGTSGIFVSDMLVAAPGTELRLGDLNGDDVVNFADIPPFISLLATGGFQNEADIDRNGFVNFSDIGPFVQLLSSG